MRFRPEQHLRRPGEIRAVRERGRRVECRAFTLWWKRRDPQPVAAAPVADPAVASSDLGANATSTTANVAIPSGPSGLPAATARVCVIASTAAVGHAVRRARAKRRLREVFRHHQAAVPADCDLLLIARAAATDWPLADLEKKFTEACRQIPPATPVGPSAPAPATPPPATS